MIPVLKINQFQKEEPLDDFYINSFSNHIHLNNLLISKPHKHNFYLCVLFTKGSGIHDIDFNSYPVAPGKVFFLRPGQTHFWKFTEKPEGFIFFHSQACYELIFLEHKLNEFPFFYSFQNPPVLTLAPKKCNFINKKLEEIYTEYLHPQLFGKLKIISLLNTVYIDLAREYTADAALEKNLSSNYLKILESLQALIDQYFYLEKFPKFYANQLHITTKHLNRVVKETLNKTTSELISDRITLEAKRLIVNSNDNLTHIADTLQFSDYSYFSKIFKTKTGFTPIDFRKKYMGH